jgi:N utilization substance protein B
MTTPRHQARQVGLQVLYRYDQSHPVDPLPSAIVTELSQHFEHFKVPSAVREFASELVAGTLRKLPDLDALIEQAGTNWKIGRMSAVDRNLLRMSIYELKHFPDTPASVVIDEAVELAKQFGTAESPAFVNGVLDAVRKR